MSKLSDKWYSLWKECGGPNLQVEVRVTPERKWRFDFAIFKEDGSPWMAFEIDGGEFIFGRHARRLGPDAEKANAAQLLGWKLYRFPTSLVNEGYVRHILGRISFNPRQGNPVQPIGAPESGLLHQRNGQTGQGQAGKVPPQKGSSVTGSQHIHNRQGKSSQAKKERKRKT